ncbi:STAU2 protein, partial [Acromyrmex charruanus]
MAKSEINLLQELSIKRGFMPIYNFSEKNINYQKQFMCNVACAKLITHGTGNSKKEAKHNAARNMLSLLATNHKIPLSVVTPQVVTSPIVTNISQNPEKVCNTSSSVPFRKEDNSNKQFTVRYNYIGMLQEFCQQRQMPTKDIQYDLIYDEGLPHEKTFTVKVSLGSLCERGTGQCKKSAKQEAAKKMLLHLNPNIIANKNTDTHNVYDKETLENNIRELGTKISECVNINKNTLSVEKLSENAKSIYLKSKTNIIDQQINPLTLKDFHMLFEKNYSNNITYRMKQKMQIILDKYPREDPHLMHEIRQDIEQVLKVKIQQVIAYSKSQNYLICLRLLSNPCITQFGIGENRMVAERRAMYNLMRAILIFIN